MKFTLEEHSYIIAPVFSFYIERKLKYLNSDAIKDSKRRDFTQLWGIKLKWLFRFWVLRYNLWCKALLYVGNFKRPIALFALPIFIFFYFEEKKLTKVPILQVVLLFRMKLWPLPTFLHSLLGGFSFWKEKRTAWPVLFLKRSTHLKVSEKKWAKVRVAFRKEVLLVK